MSAWTMTTKTFCVLATPRTGSSYLCSLLDAHPEIGCHQELFDEAQIGGLPVAPVIEDREARAYNPRRWLDEVISASYASHSEWRSVGFKLHLLQRPSVLERILFEPGIAIVLLDRADRLAQYASWRIADQSRSFRSTGDEIERSAKVEFDAEDFEAFAREHDDLYGMIRILTEGRTDVIELDYDDLVGSNDLHRVLAFLGVDTDAELHTSLRKQNPSNVLERFDNPDDVVTTLRQTRWARYLPA